MKKYIKTYISGFFMGAADIVPGVSGGTIAFILGIYEELVQTIASVNKELIVKFFTFKWGWIFKNFNWKFVVLVFGGMFTAIITLAHFLEKALENQPVLVWSFFTGLILASVPTIVRKVKGKWSVKLVGLFILGVLISLLIVNLSPQTTPNTPLFLIISGALASMAMILPGISGSFILVLLGKYEFVLSAVNSRDLVSIALIGTGAVVGILGFSKVINKLLNKYHDVSVAVLGGFVLGAVTKIWPFKSIEMNIGCSQNPGPGAWECNNLEPIYKNTVPELNQETLVALGFMVLGAITILAITKVAGGKNNHEPKKD